VAELSAAAPELTKAWLLGLLEAAPLEALPSAIPPALAVDGPGLIRLTARALASDLELGRLAADPLAVRAGALVGVEDVEGALRAVEALRRVLWAAVREARPRAAGDEVAQLAERLAAVVEVVRSAALTGLASPPAVRSESVAAQPVAAAPPAPVPVPEPEPAPVQFVVVEPAPAPAAPEPSDSVPAAAEPPAPASPAPRVRTPPVSADPVPGDPGAALWQRALADEVSVAIETGTPLALLHIELSDADRLAAAAPAEEVAGVVGRFTQAIRSITRRQDILARESDARMWVIARDTGRVGAEALGRRAAASVAAVAPWRDAPLQAAVGVAVLGEDAETAAELIAAAEEASFVAAASGSGMERPPPSSSVTQ
jgi:GGDEF domain-containing protein